MHGLGILNYLKFVIWRIFRLWICDQGIFLSANSCLWGRGQIWIRRDMNPWTFASMAKTWAMEPRPLGLTSQDRKVWRESYFFNGVFLLFLFKEIGPNPRPSVCSEPCSSSPSPGRWRRPWGRIRRPSLRTGICTSRCWRQWRRSSSWCGSSGGRSTITLPPLTSSTWPGWDSGSDTRTSRCPQR